ncbi:hypothetical protein SCARD494_14292, partial [Seiridium cardinale]
MSDVSFSVGETQLLALIRTILQ